jgi:carbonic anhydrase
MNSLIQAELKSDIPAQYRDTPVGLLLEYHNLHRPADSYTSAQLLIGMCMDNRKHLHIPDNFAYIIRTGGANLRYSEFKVSYAIAVGGVRSVALIGHTQCGMVNLIARKELFVRGLVDNAGWTADSAQDHFFDYAPMFEIGNEIDFTLSEAKRLRLRYPKIMVAPLIYRVEDNKLYLIDEGA